MLIEAGLNFYAKEEEKEQSSVQRLDMSINYSVVEEKRGGMVSNSFLNETTSQLVEVKPKSLPVLKLLHLGGAKSEKVGQKGKLAEVPKKKVVVRAYGMTEYLGLLKLDDLKHTIRLKQADHRQRLFVFPTHPRYLFFQRLLAFYKVAFYSIVFPLFLASHFNYRSSTIVSFALFLVDLFFLADFVLKAFFVPYKDDGDQEYVLNRRQIFKHYFFQYQTPFLLIALLPSDLLLKYSCGDKGELESFICTNGF